MKLLDKWKNEIDKSIARGENDDVFFTKLLDIANSITNFAYRRNKYIKLLILSFVNPWKNAALYYFQQKAAYDNEKAKRKEVRLRSKPSNLEGHLFGLNEEERRIADKYKLSAVERIKLRKALDELDEDRDDKQN